MSRPLVLAALFFVFLLAYMLTPYWNLPPETWQKVLLAALMAGGGLAWAYLGSGTVRFPLSRRGLWWFLAALALLAALNGPAILIDIPWRGDEDHHMKVTNMLADVLGLCWYLPLLGVAPVIVLAIRGRGRAERGGVGVLLLAAELVIAVVVMGGIALAKPAWTMDIARYPLLSNWMAALPLSVIRPFFGSSPMPPEWSYRIVPLVSSALIGWFCMRQLAGLHWLGRGAYVLVLGTIPIMFYYTSILYLEMPAVLLMVIVGLGAGELLKCPVRELPGKPQWYALILIGFVKENSISFLAAFVLARGLVRLRGLWSGPGRLRWLLGEAKAAFCVVFPFVTYWFYRTYLSQTPRPYSPTAVALLDPGTYGTLLRAFWDEFGVFSLLFPGGLALLWHRKQKAAAAFLGIAFAGYGALHLLDTFVKEIIGYSRYMLMFAPMILCGAQEVFARIARKGAALGLTGMVLVLIANLLMSPVNLDGARKAGWGQYRVDTMEHYYPYREAVRWIREHHPRDRIMWTGMYYHYWLYFYVGASDQFLLVPNQRFTMWTTPPENESALVEGMLYLAWENRDKVTHVLYHVLGKSQPNPVRTFGFAVEKVFQNSAHMLVLYSLPAARG